MKTLDYSAVSALMSRFAQENGPTPEPIIDLGRGTRESAAAMARRISHGRRSRAAKAAWARRQNRFYP